MDDNTERDLQRLSSSDVTVVRLADGRAELLATTLPATRRDLILPEAARIIATGRDGMNVTLGGEEYEVLAVPLEEAANQKLYAILDRSVAEGLGIYLGLQAVLLFLASFSVAVTLFGGIRIAKRITRPLSQLADVAREIARGNYDVKVRSTGDDEIGELRRVRGMVKGLSGRDIMRDALGRSPRARW